MECHGVTPCAYRFEGDPYLQVQWRGTGLWAICRGGGNYNRLGEWEIEPMPSNRDEEFFDRCRYTLDEALGFAIQIIEKEKNEHGSGQVQPE